MLKQESKYCNNEDNQLPVLADLEILENQEHAEVHPIVKEMTTNPP